MKTGWLLALLLAGAAQAQDQAWTDRARSPDERAALLEHAMTQEEKLGLLHGFFATGEKPWWKPAGAIGSAGYVPGLPRLGIPALQETDAGLGITNPNDVRPSDTALAWPSGLAAAASFDPALAYERGTALGREAAARGFNVLLGPGVNLVRDPRGGRSFEYAGEDPLLSGVIAGETVRGIQDQHVIATLKHFALNDQESGRQFLSVDITEKTAQESDLLAFEIAIEHGHPGAVMCAYNKVNGQYACGNDALLNRILKGDWHYPGWVMSDWGAVHAVADFTGGLDQESAQELDPLPFLTDPLAADVANGFVPQTRVDDAVHRILRSLFAAGLMDHPPKPPADDQHDLEFARRGAAEGIVLLSNSQGVLPLAKPERCLAVIGGQADAGVAAGGGSSQVTPLGGYARRLAHGNGQFQEAVFDPPSPLSSIQAKLPGTRVLFTDGRYPAEAAIYAALCDAAIVFATQWSAEASDLPDLSLPSGQDALIEAVANKNRHTIVVLESASAVKMPWLPEVGAVLEAWYSGSAGADAIADVLFGDVGPSGRLPITFPASEDDLPNISVAGQYDPPGTSFPVHYPEGAATGYRWFAQTNRKPLFPFGFGLTYTSFDYANLRLTAGPKLRVEFDVRNTGTRQGVDIPQAYLVSRAGKPIERLLGWSRRALAPGETQHVSIEADPRLLADFDPVLLRWRRNAGEIGIGVGPNAATMPLTGTMQVAEQILPP